MLCIQERATIRTPDQCIIGLKTSLIKGATEQNVQRIQRVIPGGTCLISAYVKLREIVITNPKNILAQTKLICRG
jgi:hypothetical protein